MDKIKITQPKGALAEIIGSHPHAGKTAEFVEIRTANGLGRYPVFADSDGIEFFVLNKRHIKWKK